MIEIQNWLIVGNRLYGTRPDGKYIRTSEIVKIDGPVVTTKSGTEYKLLKPHPDYVNIVQEVQNG